MEMLTRRTCTVRSHLSGYCQMSSPVYSAMKNRALQSSAHAPALASVQHFALLGRFDPDHLDRPHNTTVAGQVPMHFLPLRLDWAKTDVRSAFGAYNATIFEHGYCYGVPITVNVDISLN
jgi:hypothetical protein